MPFAAQGKQSGGALGAILFSAAFSAELDFPRLKPIYEFTSFRWTEVQLPLLKQGAPTRRANR